MGSGFFMSKVVFIVDGLNLYHALDYFETGPDHDRFKKYKWLNLKKLALLFADKKDTVEDILYFTTLVTWDPGKIARHRLFIRAPRERRNISCLRRVQKEGETLHCLWEVFSDL